MEVERTVHVKPTQNHTNLPKKNQNTHTNPKIGSLSLLSVEGENRRCEGETIPLFRTEKGTKVLIGRIDELLNPGPLNYRCWISPFIRKGTGKEEKEEKSSTIKGVTFRLGLATTRAKKSGLSKTNPDLEEKKRRKKNQRK